MGASLLHIPLKSKQGTLYTRDGRGNKGQRKRSRRKKKHGRGEKTGLQERKWEQVAGQGELRTWWRLR